MENLITIEFTKKELKPIIMDYYGMQEDDFDFNDFTTSEIHDILIEMNF